MEESRINDKAAATTITTKFSTVLCPHFCIRRQECDKNPKSASATMMMVVHSLRALFVLIAASLRQGIHFFGFTVFIIPGSDNGCGIAHRGRKRNSDRADGKDFVPVYLPSSSSFSHPSRKYHHYHYC